MTLLAVLDVAELRERSHFSVADFHVNLWSLGAFGGKRRSFVLDVGARIHAADRPVSHLTLAIPFGTTELECLHDKVTNPKTAGLIFNAEVSVDKSDIVFDGEVLQIHAVSSVNSKKVDALSDNFFSLWNLELAKPIPAGSIGYFRVRFPVTGAGKTWQWQRQRLFRSGATVDLRVSDGRSAALIADGAQLLDRVRPIGRVFAFVMVPAWMHIRSVSPVPHYIRLLEGKLWKDYLGRDPEWRPRSRLVVYYWKSERHTAADGEHILIDKNKPFQIFGDFGIDSHPSRIATVLASALVSILGLGLVYAIPLQPWVLGAIDWVTKSWIDFFTGAWTVTNPINGVIVVVGLAIAARNLARSSRKFMTRIRAGFLKAEATVFRMISER